MLLWGIHPGELLYGVSWEGKETENTVDKMIAHVNTLPDCLQTTFKENWVVVIDKTIPMRLSSGFVLMDNNDYDTSGLIFSRGVVSIRKSTYGVPRP